jgi:hypothetical protein
MPATEVSPALRRRLSDDARQLLRSALGASPTHTTPDPIGDLRELSLADRLQNFRGKIRLEVPAISNAVRLRIIVSNATYLLRYHVERLGAEVSVFSKTGASTSWITLASGENIQLRKYASMPSSPADVCQEISTLIDILEAVDLFDIFRACLHAVPVPSSPGTLYLTDHVAYSATTDKSRYSFIVDRDSGKPLAVTQTALPSAVGMVESVNLIVEDYLRCDGGISVPRGIKSDVEIMIDTAMYCFSQWSPHGQRRIHEVFEIVDKDEDQFVSGQDVYAQLLAVGHSQQQCSNIVLEMARLLCDTSDPAEEFGFYKFCGFWVTMLADTYRVSDPANEVTVLSAFERLFLGL